MPDGALALGVDVGATKTHGVVVDGRTVLAETTLPTRHGELGTRATIVEVAEKLAGSLGVASFASVGIGIPGIVDVGNGVVTVSLNLGIADVALGSTLTEHFGVPVRLENDVKATALGAQRVLDAAVTDLCYLNAGTGMSAAFIADGRIVRGASNGAGELGHFSIEPDGEPCVCGQRGCLEAIAGGGRVASRLAELGADLATLPASPDPRARAESRRLVNALSVAACLVLTTYDPQVIVLGGGLFANAPWLQPAIAAELGRRAADSPFLRRMMTPGLLVRLPADVPVAALGAAAAGRAAQPREPG